LGGTDASVGAVPATGTVGELVPTIEVLSVDVDRGPGLYVPEFIDLWAVDVASGAVSLNGVPGTATAGQIEGVGRGGSVQRLSDERLVRDGVRRPRALFATD